MRKNSSLSKFQKTIRWIWCIESKGNHKLAIRSYSILLLKYHSPNVEIVSCILLFIWSKCWSTHKYVFLILGVGIANIAEHSPHDSLVNMYIINFVCVNLLDSPKLLQDRLHYYTCFTYKEVREFVQGQTASNCQNEKFRNNTIHPTTSKLPLTTDKCSIKRGTVYPNL